jgi:hypothetical protein
MPSAKELTVAIPDKPGALAKCLGALAEGGINLLGYQSYVEEGESLARFLVDDVPAATKVLGGHHMIFEVTDVAIVNLKYRPGELARAAALLGKAQVNVNYCYAARDIGATQALAVFGVDNLRKAVAALDEAAVKEC